jgi:hypothetical protein
MAEPQISQISSSQTTIPDYAKPYVQNLLGQAQAVTNTTQNPYMQYMGSALRSLRLCNSKPLRVRRGCRLHRNCNKLQNITGLASQAALNYEKYNPAAFSAYTVQNPSLNYYQMDPSQGVTTESFTRPSTQDLYMSPYMNNVVARQQADAQRQSEIASQIQGAQAARSGAFGGSGDYLMRGQARNNLARQQGDIFAQGQQAAFTQGQQQFNQEQAARLQANLANQQAGLQVGGQNLQAKLGVQQLGAGQDLQAQLANQNQLMQAQQLARAVTPIRCRSGASRLADSADRRRSVGQSGSEISLASRWASISCRTSTALSNNSKSRTC